VSGTLNNETVDYTSGQSQLDVFTPSNTISELVTTYSGTNNTGIKINQTVDYADGQSQLDSFNPSSTISQLVTTYSGTNDTGIKINQTVDYTDGQSQLDSFNPSGTISQLVTTYSGLDDTGTKINQTVDYTDGQSQLDSFNPSGTISQLVTTYSGLDDTGTKINQVVDYTDGQSQLVSFSPSSSISEMVTTYSGTNETGNILETLTDYSNGSSAESVRESNGSYETTDYSGPNGTGTITGGYGHDDSVPHNDVPYDDAPHNDVPYDDVPYDDVPYDDVPYDDNYSYDDFGGTSGRSVGSASTDINVVGEYDLSHGFITAAAAADAAWNKANAAVAASTDPAIAPPSVFEGTRWPSTTITWSFAIGSGSASAPISGSVQAQYQSVIEQAFGLWGAALGLTFIQAPPGAKSDIQVGWGAFDTTDTSVVGYTTYQSVDGILQPGALIRLEDPSEVSLTQDLNGALTYSSSQTTLLQVALHEIGHAIGLAESSDPRSIMFPDLGPENTTISESDAANAASLYGGTTSAANSLSIGTTFSVLSSDGQPLQFLHATDATANEPISGASIGGSEPNISVSSAITLSHIISGTKLTFTGFSTHVSSLVRSGGTTTPGGTDASRIGAGSGALRPWDTTVDQRHPTVVVKPS
jgi:hypothetical protein